jgi:hypothetical protein
MKIQILLRSREDKRNAVLHNFQLEWGDSAMKFMLTNVAARSSRFGSIKDIERLPGVVLETPLLLLYTKVESCFSMCHLYAE